jgi:AraC-like DNA-binding protein
MISFGILSISLLMLAGQSVVLGIVLLGARENKIANRFLAALILAIASMVTPYIIGFAGFYDVYPWLSFAPFVTSLAFGPLLYLHAQALTTGTLPKAWHWHLAPFALQFLAQALIFPLPLAMKNQWDSFAYAPYLDPAFDLGSFISIAIYGALVWQHYQRYKKDLAQIRADDARFDPSWLRNAVLAVGGLGLMWFGFFVADQIDPTRNYFDKYWLYMGIAAIGAYLGVAGWRNANLAYPVISIPEPASPSLTSPAPERDWQALSASFIATIDDKKLWLDPDLTLTSLARTLGTNTTYLSKALNDGLGQSFSAFINQRRVETVKALLMAKPNAGDLLSVAFEAGFNSKASFNRAFGEFTGMGPAAWRRMQSLKS